MLWILLVLVAMDLASNSVSVPSWAYIILIIAMIIFSAIEALAD